MGDEGAALHGLEQPAVSNLLELLRKGINAVPWRPSSLGKSSEHRLAPGHTIDARSLVSRVRDRTNHHQD